MPGWNECSIYDASCRNQTCAHPTNPRNQGVQCRTMLSQRPCGSIQCTREECSSKRIHAACGQEHSVLDTVCPSKDEDDPTYVLTGLTENDMRHLLGALRVPLSRSRRDGLSRGGQPTRQDL